MMDWSKYREVFTDVDKRDKLTQQRLIAVGATIEAESGVEMDAELARLLGRHLKAQAADAASEVSRYLGQRDEKKEDDGR